jgi:MarR family transcriptional regulator, 2-MHQ and catechol-resistance regulon repressor
MIKVGDDFEDEYPGASALATECYANMVRTGDLLIGMHNQQAWDDHRLSATAKQALAVIEGAGEPLEPGVVAERLIITTGSMTSLLDTLEKRGLIVRMPHPQDRRKLLVDVTPEAVAIINDLIPSFHQREKTIVEAALSEPEQRRLLEFVARIQNAAREHAGDPPDRSAVRVVPDSVRRQT